MKKQIQKIQSLKENYYKPTPSKWRKIGDAIQDTAILAAGIAALFTPPAWIPVAIAALGRIGKIITNFNT